MSGKQSKKNTSLVDKNKGIDAEDDFDGIDADLNDSLQKNNELFTLKSEINSLKIEKQKLSIQHQQALKSVEQKNKQVSSQNHKLKRQNSNLSNKILTLQRQNEQLKQLIDSHKHQFQNNRKTADFHRSMQDGEQNIGASQLINELLQKDKQILQLKANLQRKQSNQSLNNKNFDSGSLSVEKKQEQNRNLKTIIEELKAKQIAYKRQYEEILTGKQELIRKIAAQNEESMKRINQSKERVINEARKQVQSGLKNQELLKHQIKKLEQKSQNMESMLNKLGGEYAKKEKQLIMHHEQEKQQATKNILQKIKKQYRQKEQKIKKSENRIQELQNELVIAKQQTSKLKNQNNSMNKINKILQSNIKQIEDYKSKLQIILQQKDKQMANAQEQYFIKLTQLQRLRIQDNHKYQNKILSIEEELISKKNLTEKYQKMLEQKSNKENSGNLKQENGLLEEIQALRNSKFELSQQVQLLEEKNKLEIEKYYDLQRSIRNEYQNKLSALESQLIKLRQKLSEQKKQLFQQNLESMENIEEKYKKLQNISQLQEFQIREKIEEIQKLGKNKIDKQKQIRELNQKLSQFKEKYDNLSADYASLESLYEEIKDKYKTGVENMKCQIETMTRKISQQRKNAQKRRMQGTIAEEQLRQQLKLSKQQIRELEEKLDEYKNLREQRKEDDEKVQKISQQVGTLAKQNQSLQTLTKSQSKALKQAQHNNKIHEQQKSKLLQYIQQLQQNASILSKKLTISSNKEISYSSIINKLDKQLKNLKLEYSVCLEEMNLVLQKCKQLEEVSRESISHMEMIRQKYEMLNLQYMDLNDQKNKHCEELYGAYDQVNKLNMVLMTKEQQLIKFKNIADNAQKNKQIVTQTIHHYMPAQITTIPHGPMIPMSQSMPSSFNSMQVQYASNSLSPILSPNSDTNANFEQDRSIMRPGGVRYDQKNHVFVSQKNSNIRLDENRDRNYGYKNSTNANKGKNIQDIPNVKRVTL